MPSIHKIWKLQACSRGSRRGATNNRFTRTIEESRKLAAVPDRNLTTAGFTVNTLVRLLCPSRSVDTTRSIFPLDPLSSSPSRRISVLDAPEVSVAAESRSSQQSSFHQFPLRRDGSDKFSCRQSSGHDAHIFSKETLRHLSSSTRPNGGYFPHRRSRMSLPEGSGSIMPASPNGAWTERRWTASRVEDRVVERVSFVETSRTYSEGIGEQAERGGRCLESKSSPEMVWDSSTTPKAIENGAVGLTLMKLVGQAGPSAAEGFRNLQRCLLSHVKIRGPRIGSSMGGLCTTGIVRQVCTGELGALRKHDLAGKLGKSGVNSALLSGVFDLRHGIMSPAKVSPLRAAHDVSLASDAAASRGDHQSNESSRAGQALRFLSGACNLPHPAKMKTGGEDAFFICSDKHVFGVADGVGGWSDFGIDAGQYARELMSHASSVVRDDTMGLTDPADVMEKAHSLTRCKGSATACILALTDSSLVAANLGDSGFVVVRNNRTVFKSPPQQHQFNIPFQLEHGGSDPPRMAQVFSVPIREGDVVITATDGLFDNVYDTELITHVVQAGRGHLTPQVTAERIAKLAHSHAKDKNRQTPFATAAQDAGFRLTGGKMDDITVIVAYIIRVK